MDGDAMSDFYGPISDATFQKALHFARNIYSFHRESGLGPQAARRKTWDAVQRASYGVRSQFGAHITYSHEIGSVVSQAAEEVEAERKNPSSPGYAPKKRPGSRRDPSRPIGLPAKFVPAAELTAGEINRALDQIDKKSSKLTDRFIAQGRGSETAFETWKKSDPLAREWQDLRNRYSDLRNEIELRYGPRAPSRLPSGRGFGPRASRTG